jgi:tetratricopeptide (TPR) repeat protein
MKRRSLLLAAALLLAAVLATWSNHFRNDFHFDDAHTIVNNLYIRDVGNIPRFFRDATTFSTLPANQSYRPLVSTTLAIDYRLGGGLAPFAFHLSTFLLFLAQGAAMFLLFRRILASAGRADEADAVSLFAVGWYLLHPAAAETINYVIARGDSISTLFVVAALLLHVRFRGDRRRHLALAALALGVLTKPVAVVFAPLLILWELQFGAASPELAPREGGGLAARWRTALAAALPSLLATVALLALVKALSPPTWTPGGTSRFAYVITQPLVILHYLATFFLPLSLSADTDWQASTTLLDPRVVGGAAGCLLLIGAAVASARQRAWRPVSFGLWWFLIGLAPTSFVFPLAEVMNDHRVFLPYVGLSLAVTWAARLLVLHFARTRRPGRPAGALAVCAAVLLLAPYAFGTHRRNETWRTEETLWRDVTLKSPRNGRGWMNYGLTLMERGEYAGAEAAFRTALPLTPNYAYLHINLGVVEAATGRPREAEAEFRTGLALAPGNPASYVFFARFLLRQGRRDEAVPLLLRALELAPAHVDARSQLLAAYESGGQLKEAVDLARQTLALAPGDPAATAFLARLNQPRPPAAAASPRVGPGSAEQLLELSLQRYRAGDFAGCIAAAEAALQLRPDYAAALNNVCAARNSLGQWEQAAAACERSLALDPTSALTRNNLAWARSRMKKP